MGMETRKGKGAVVQLLMGAIPGSVPASGVWRRLRGVTAGQTFGCKRERNEGLRKDGSLCQALAGLRVAGVSSLRAGSRCCSRCRARSQAHPEPFASTSRGRFSEEPSVQLTP